MVRRCCVGGEVMVLAFISLSPLFVHSCSQCSKGVIATNCRKNPRNAILRFSSFYMSFHALEHFVFVFFIIKHFNFPKLPIIIGSLPHVYGLGRVPGQNTKNVP